MQYQGTVEHLLHAAERALYAETVARRDGFLQRLDPRVKLVGFLALIVAAVQSRRLWVILGLFAVALVLALLSRVPIRTLAVRAWMGVLLFTGVIALPALLIVPGRAVYQLPLLGWTLTEQGLRSTAFLIARAETSVTFGLLLILCTPWTHVLKALRVLRVPVVFVVILGMTHRYIFLLIQMARNMFASRRSRTVGDLSGAERRRLLTATVGVLLSKSLALSNEVYRAMRSRGYRGEVYTVDDFEMAPLDWGMMAAFIGLAMLAFWFGWYGLPIAS